SQASVGLDQWGSNAARKSGKDDYEKLSLPTGSAYPSGDAPLRNPITGIADCCARAASGHAVAPPSSTMNSRRFTASDSRASHRKHNTPRHGKLLHPSTWAE